MNTNSSSCYMCDKIAVSREHAPPRCLFPKGKNFRSELVTVPSCEEHNQELSHADQILLQLLISQPIEINEPFQILKKQFLNKESINFNRKFNSFTNQIAKVTPATFINEITGEKINSGLIHFKKSTLVLYQSLEKLGCALYYHEFQRKLSGKFFVHLDILVTEESISKSFQELYKLNKTIFDMFEIKFKGSVPKVFQYRIYNYNTPGGEVIIEFLFYEKIRGLFKFSKSDV